MSLHAVHLRLITLDAMLDTRSAVTELGIQIESLEDRPRQQIDDNHDGQPEPWRIEHVST